MKKALSLLLVVLMLVGMLPMTVLNASAADVTATITFDDTTKRTTFTTEQAVWQESGITVTNNKASGSNIGDYSKPARFYKNTEVKVEFLQMSKIEFKWNSDKPVTGLTGGLTAAGFSNSNDATNKIVTVTFAEPVDSITFTATDQFRLDSITVTYDDPNAVGCAHTNTETVEAVAATCTKAGNTAGVKCTDCGATVSGNETIEALGHTNDEGVVTAPTCTEDGYTTYTCTVCGSAKKSDYVDATGHNYVDGVCSGCNAEQPTGLAGKYYIAAIRSSGNYMYMSNDLGTASTKRYQQVDSGLTTLPTSIETVVDAQVFELIYDASAGTYKIKTGDKYLGWTSGNSGALVDEASAIAATIETAENGAYTIHFTASDAERYLSLNSNASNAYFAWYKVGQITNLYLVPVASEGGEGGSEPEPEVTEPEVTEPSAPATCPDENHNFVDGKCTICGTTEPVGPIDPADPTEGEVSTTTIDFSTTEQRVSLDTSSQVWKNGDATVTNNKAGSSSNVADYSNPVRFYKSTELIIALAGMTKIEIVCNSAAYATTLAGCISDSTVTVTTDDKTVTIVPAALIDSYTITLTGGQVRVNSITITASTCEHVWGEWVETTKPNCTTAGVNTTTCSVCNNSKTESVPATGHSYNVDGNCTVCGITPAQVVDMAYALEDGKALEGKYTLTGVISAINEIYSEQYNNITVTMDVVGVTGKPIKCFQMKGEGVDQIGTGDTITVTGSLKRYNDTTVEFDAGCTLDKWEDTGSEFVRPETPEEIVNAAYGLAEDAILQGGTYTLTGVITNVGTAYNSKYSNVTVTIQIGDMTDKPIVCFRLAGTGAELICVGDTVTVSGNLKNYKGTTVEFDEGCTLDSYVINKGHTEEIDAAVDATCTEAGKTEGKHCSVCNLVIVAQEDVPGHTIEHVAAVVPANCQETGHDEYWYCATCDVYYGDAEYSYQVNPAWINYNGDHVRPEGAAVCAVVTCTLCGEDSYGEPCDRGDAPECQDATCVNCGETIPGWDCNYNTGEEETPLPLCQPGDCVYCGKHYDKLYDCENGALAPCLEGECSYGCGAKFPATEAHTVVPCVGGLCETCWETIEATGHNYVEGTCTNCGAADPNAPVASVEMTAMEVSFDAEILLWTYFLIPDELINNDEAYVLVTKDGAWATEETKIYMYQLREQGPTKYGDYKIEQGVASGEMGRAVTVQFYDGEGNLLYIQDTDGSVVASVSRCVVDYAKSIFEKGNAKQKKLVAAMLTYGGYSQIKFKVDADSPVYNILPEYGYEIPTLSDITADTIGQEMTVVGGNAGVSYSAQETYLDSAIYHRVYFKLASGESAENFKYEITYVNVNGTTYVEEVEPGYDSKYDEYYVDILDIPAAYLDHMYTITVTNTQSGETLVVNTSVLVWAKTVVEKVKVEANINLAKAVYYYNQAANTYFGK